MISKSTGIKSPKIIEKFMELYETGKIAELETENNNPVHELIKIHGIGPAKAKDLVKNNINSIDDLCSAFKNDTSLLTQAQAIGLKYFNDCQQRIERNEIDLYNKIFTKYFNNICKNELLCDSKSIFQIIGSYRRGCETSGDIDIIITNNNNNSEIYKLFIDIYLKKIYLLRNYLMDVLKVCLSVDYHQKLVIKIFLNLVLN